MPDVDVCRDFRQDLFQRVALWATPRGICVDWILIRGIDDTGHARIEIGRGNPPADIVTGLIFMDSVTGKISERC